MIQTVRQVASGLIYALISIILVVGSISVALSERNVVPGTTSTSRPPPTATSNPTGTQPAVSATASPTIMVTAPVYPSLVYPSLVYPSLTSTRFVPSSTHVAAVTCGPFAGWIKAYVVQPGDSLFHIATVYHTTVSSLQRANCRFSNLIFAGERLWVPNVPTITPGVTIIPPFFDTPTEMPTEPIDLTPRYSTPTAAPTDTPVETPTDTAVPDP